MSVETVNGLVSATMLGRTLPHEHLLINLLRERRSDGLINDELLVTEELSVYRAQGGVSLVDLSSGSLTQGTGARPGLPSPHRDPSNVEALSRISRASGINVVMGTGHYRDPYLDEVYLDRHSADGIADDLVRDLTEAIPGTKVRAGVIGEIGSDGWFISAREERSFRAAARASIRTGSGVYTHAARWSVGLTQLDLLQSEGMNPARIAIGHVDTVKEPGYALTLAKRGVYVGLDTMFSQDPREISFRIGLLTDLIAAGFADRVLLSQDVCVPSQLTAGGGPGFGIVHGAFATAATAAGIDPQVFETITDVNPARFLEPG